MTCPKCKKEAHSFVHCPIKKNPVCMTCCWNCDHMKRKDTSIPKCYAKPLEDIVEE